MKTFSTLALAALVTGTLAGPATALDNADFSQLDQRAFGTVDYITDANTIGFLPSWTLLAAQGGKIQTASGFGANGDSAFAFNQLGEGFGDNKLEQCLPIDPTQSLSIRYAVNTSLASNDVRTRLNPNFYPDMDACEVNLQANENTNRLAFDGSNQDFDQQLGQSGLDAGQWFDLAPAVFAAGSLPLEANVLRISLRARDRSGQSADLFFDNVRVTQGDSEQNLVRNAGFEHLEIISSDYLNAGAGWQVVATQRAAAGDASFSLSGGNVVYFEQMAGGFGESRMDVCVPVTGNTSLRPTVRATSFTPHPGLGLRIDMALFTDTDCTTAADSALNIQQDFPIDAAPGEWLTLRTDEHRDAGALAGIGSARLSLRGRDRTGADNQPGVFARALYIDEATLEDGVSAPTFTPPGQEFSSAELVITVNGPAGSTLYYTLDGSDPEQTSAAMQPGETLTLSATTTVKVIAVLNGDASPIRAATYTKVAPPFVPPTGPLNRSAGSVGLLFGVLGVLLMIRRRS